MFICSGGRNQDEVQLLFLRSRHGPPGEAAQTLAPGEARGPDSSTGPDSPGACHRESRREAGVGSRHLGNRRVAMGRSHSAHVRTLPFWADPALLQSQGLGELPPPVPLPSSLCSQQTIQLLTAALEGGIRSRPMEPLALGQGSTSLPSLLSSPKPHFESLWTKS